MVTSDAMAPVTGNRRGNRFIIMLLMALVVAVAIVVAAIFLMDARFQVNPPGDTEAVGALHPPLPQPPMPVAWT